ncbi:MAG: alpha/beta fold hydrolase [Bacteroidota bacterium]|nr:alpha/beta fold hydrolase [Bacteroidota bacterium]
MSQQLLYSRIEGEGSPLLILHGYLGMSDNWKTLSARYAENGFQVHAIDLRNHGRSFHSDDFSHDLMVQDLLYYCKHYHLEKVSVIGHSMGGKLAMFFAITYPQMIDKLVVVDISARQYPPHHQDILSALAAVDFENHTTRSQIQEVVSKTIQDADVVQFLMKNIYRITPEKLGFRMNLSSLTANYENMLIAVPMDKTFEKEVLFVRGAKSKYISDQDHQQNKMIFTNAWLKTVADAGHWVHAENPSDFFEYTIAYLLQ